MALSLLLARLVLTGVFAVAGVAKLTDPSGSRRAMRDFGVPRRLVPAAGLLLPLAELAAAVALVPVATAWAGAVATLALLLLFLAGLGVTLARGRHPDCHCFGQLSSSPVGWRTVTRNALLAVVAGFIAVEGRRHPGTDLLGSLGLQRGGDVSGWIGVGLGMVALAVSGVALWLLLQLLAQNGRLLTRLDGLEERVAQVPSATSIPGPPVAPVAPSAGLPVGTLAPAFQLSGLYGETLTLDALRAAGKPVLLAFMDPGCGPCNALLPDVARWQRELGASLTLAVISRGSTEENLLKVREHGLTTVLVQQDREVASSYLASGTPSMVMVRPDGTIGTPLAQGAEGIRALLARNAGLALPLAPLNSVPAAAATPDQPCPNCGKLHAQADVAAAAAVPTGLLVGSPAPAVLLPDLDGTIVDLADYQGRETVLLFWNPGCRFCQQMLPELKAWEAHRPAGAPALLVIASGTAEAVRAEGLLSTVLVDSSFSTGPTFGANGTPMAVRLTAAGTLASVPAAGAQAVLELLNGRVNA